jgi:hypothetical protein
MNPGDTSSSAEPVLEVSTDKIDTEIPSPLSGTLVGFLAYRVLGMDKRPITRVALNLVH